MDDLGTDLGETFEQPAELPAVPEGPDLLGESAATNSVEEFSPPEYSPRDELAAVEEGDFPSLQHSYAIDTAPDQPVTVHGSGLLSESFENPEQFHSPDLEPISVGLDEVKASPAPLEGNTLEPPEGWSPGGPESDG